MTTPDDPTWTEQEIDARANDIPPYFPPPPGVDPGISQDPHLFDQEHAAWFGASLACAAVAGTAAAMVTAAVSLLGLGEHPANHNYVTEFYNANVARIGDGPWCDMGITYEAWHSGNVVAVCGAAKGFAYTPAHGEWFRSVGRWHAGLHGIQPGDVVFFNWSGRKSINDIEHVGLVEHVYDDGTVATIECNISDACRREHRDSTFVVGYGRPDYQAQQQQEDDMPDYVSLGMKKAQPVKAGSAAHAVFDVEYRDDDKSHADGSYPGILSGGKNGTQFIAEVDASGVAGTMRLVETDPAKKYAVTKTYPLRPIGSETFIGWCDAGKHLYVEVHPSADGSVSVAAKAQYWPR